MSGVDYSKWEKMAADMSDSEDEYNNNKPVVTTFDQPQSVTFGGTPPPQGSEGQGGGYDASGTTDPIMPVTQASAAASAEARAAARTLATDKELAENGGWVTVDDGEQQRRLRYVWRQTRAEVMVVVPVPPGTGARDVVDVSLRTKPDTVAEGVADLIRVVIKRKHVGGGDADSGDGGGDRARSDNSLIVLEGELSFQAKLTSGDEEVDWEIKDFPGTRVARDRRLGEPSAAEAGAAAERIEADTVVAESTGGGTESCPGRRGIEVTLRKHCPIPNAVVWWRSLLKGDPEIDISSINGRAKNNSHQSAWEEAMGMFKEKMAERKQRGKISVDTGDN